jgi:oxygen-independent coproporphyrinogen-3 oxidase
MEEIGLYLHVPFCRAKCAYCDFNSYSGRQGLHGPYLEALRHEACLVLDLLTNGEAAPAFGTLYVGGGTPTVLPAAELAALIETLRSRFALADDAEITVEANPGTVDTAVLRRLRKAGANRLSLGVQSFDDHLLRVLGRIHTAQEARKAAREACRAGFDNLNLDLILGIPGQTMQSWQDSVRCALELSPQHLSLYALTIEQDTPLCARIAAGELAPVDEDLAADMYEWAEGVLPSAGYAHYEISNWALQGYACRHNLVYWRNEPYVGLGAGAHSWWRGTRWANLALPEAYVAALQAGGRPIAMQETIEPRLEMGETMMMGLRLLEEGVSCARFQSRFGVPLEGVYGAEIRDLCDRDLLERTPEGIRLTQRGHLLGNQVFAEFLPARARG